LIHGSVISAETLSARVASIVGSAASFRTTVVGVHYAVEALHS